MSPLEIEYAFHEQSRERERLMQEIREARKVEDLQRKAESQPSQPLGLRRRLGRKLVSLGLRLDPQSEGPAAS